MSRSAQEQEKWLYKIFSGNLTNLSHQDLDKEFLSLNGYELLAIRFFIKSTDLKKLVESGVNPSEYKQDLSEVKEIRKKLAANKK